MRYNATNDLVFKKTFTSIGNEDILKGLVQDLTGRSFEKVEPTTPYTIENYKQTEIITENEGQLLSTEVDVRAVTSSGAIVTIEMQIQLAKTFIDRTQFYAFSTYVNNYANNPAAKDKYASIQDVYSINICDSPLVDPNDRAVRQYELLDLESYESIRQLTRHRIHTVSMIYMDLTNRNIKESHSAYHWWRYFNGLEPLENAPEYIFQAIDVVNAANLNQEEIEMITQAEYKKANAEAYAQDVYEQGAEQGADQERVKTIKSMLKLNYNLEDIAKVFDMTVEEVQYLAKR